MDPSSNPKGLPDTAQKIRNLMGELDSILNEASNDEFTSIIGDEALQQCRGVQASLHQQKTKIESLSGPAILKSHGVANIPSSISPLSVTPWKSSMIPTDLPPLPQVLDPTLEASAFIHTSLGAGNVTDLNYERLEWVGDIYLELAATLLISQTFPSWTPGKCSQLRERLVKNITLSGFARQYGFDKRFRGAEDVLAMAKSRDREHMYTKLLGDLFEAYFAAVILSDPTNGVKRAVEWVKDLWGMIVAKEIIQEERNGLKIDNPMWKLRGNEQPVQDVIVKSADLPLPPKIRLQKMICSRGIKLTYKDIAPEGKDPTNNLALFTVGVFLEGWGEKNKMLGSGKANGKKEAGAKAAEMALANKQLMKLYAEKKKLHDAQMALEQEALEEHEGM